MDNLLAHKSVQVVNVFQGSQRLELLFLPSNSPQFSPIENMFGYLKGKLKDMIFKGKEDLTFKVVNAMFSLTEQQMHGFF